MSDPIDRLACRAACDLVEEAGFDPSVVAFFRKACRPTVAEVLPLAIAYRKEHRERNGPMSDFFLLNRVATRYLLNRLEDAREQGDSKLEELAALLLEMSGKERTRVAWMSREAIREWETEDELRRGWTMPAPANPYPWSSTNIRAALETLDPANTGCRVVVAEPQAAMADEIRRPVMEGTIDHQAVAAMMAMIPPDTPMTQDSDGTFSPSDPNDPRGPSPFRTMYPTWRANNPPSDPAT